MCVFCRNTRIAKKTHIVQKYIKIKNPAAARVCVKDAQFGIRAYQIIFIYIPTHPVSHIMIQPDLTPSLTHRACLPACQSPRLITTHTHTHTHTHRAKFRSVNKIKCHCHIKQPPVAQENSCWKRGLIWEQSRLNVML